ncbi:xylan alpha-(1-_2)-glucuronosidase [Cellulomonas biazotea]|uniref:Xylan alpha-(1->2)-glucuronosidase n=2 Tax=Cellulomonas biazotea TaxID=1709 RepID=A0A402DQ16_9CELL|nr:xylan alpha-(1->2)-glucuronosidase [Cellulomonas biazotea]
MSAVHPMWLPDDVFRPLGRRAVRVDADASGDPVLATVRDEVAAAVTRFGGTLAGPDDRADLVLTVEPADGPDTHTVARSAGTTTVRATGARALLHGLHDVVRLGERAFADDLAERHVAPVNELRMLDHWDNVDVHPVMGQVERGYAGGSIFYADGRVRDDLSRVAQYARLLGSVGINAVGLNNVNVHRTEARLLTDGLPDVARLAALFRPHGIRVFLSVSFAAPITVGGLPTSDPLDPDVQAWWAQRAADVYAVVPDFGGFVVKADSEGQPGPFAYGRDHADGANLLARALRPFGGTVFWRAFVYDHRQDWRDRSTDRARAAFDHFSPLDGRFDDNVVLQVKYGPMDFQAREPVSPVIAAMPRTRLAVELQVTQEYTGQQRHAVWLGPQWSQILRFPLWGEGGRTVADVAAGLGDRPGADPGTDPGTAPGAGPGAGAPRRAGLVAVSNVGDDAFWTGHPLAQANLYTFARLAWDPEADPLALLDEWVTLTFPSADDEVRAALHAILDDSWRTYEDYTAPLGVGFMVRPGHHYGPDVDGYEYTPWGTYHFADRDGIGVDRTRATGTGFTGQYPAPWRDVYEDLATCPDDLLLFFHHVPWSHVLHSGVSVAQHVYDTHADGAARTEANAARWARVAGRVPDDLHGRVTERLAEQVRSAHEWSDQLRSYVHRHSGIPDARGRTIH